MLLAGCSVPTYTLAQAVSSCAADRSPRHAVEVYVPRATVVRVFGIHWSSSGEHEAFAFDASGSSVPVMVEDNVSIAGVVPLRAGATISLLGQYECDDGVMHWTHHDPSGRHRPGYIEADSRVYQ
jgi:hypothetical protein